MPCWGCRVPPLPGQQHSPICPLPDDLLMWVDQHLLAKRGFLSTACTEKFSWYFRQSYPAWCCYVTTRLFHRTAAGWPAPAGVRQTLKVAFHLYTTFGILHTLQHLPWLVFIPCCSTSDLLRDPAGHSHVTALEEGVMPSAQTRAAQLTATSGHFGPPGAFLTPSVGCLTQDPGRQHGAGAEKENQGKLGFKMGTLD